jgi:hypothetical protein
MKRLLALSLLLLCGCAHRPHRACVLAQNTPEAQVSTSPPSAGIEWARQNGVDVCHMHGGEK